jgi:hypothetical protein
MQLTRRGAVGTRPDLDPFFTGVANPSTAFSFPLGVADEEKDAVAVADVVAEAAATVAAEDWDWSASSSEWSRADIPGQGRRWSSRTRWMPIHQAHSSRHPKWKRIPPPRREDLLSRLLEPRK